MYTCEHQHSHWFRSNWNSLSSKEGSSLGVPAPHTKGAPRRRPRLPGLLGTAPTRGSGLRTPRTGGPAWKKTDMKWKGIHCHIKTNESLRLWYLYIVLWNDRAIETPLPTLLIHKTGKLLRPPTWLTMWTVVGTTGTEMAVLAAPWPASRRRPEPPGLSPPTITPLFSGTNLHQYQQQHQFRYQCHCFDNNND